MKRVAAAVLILASSAAVAAEPCLAEGEAAIFQNEVVEYERGRLRDAFENPPKSKVMIRIEHDYVEAYNALYRAVEAYTACESREANKSSGSERKSSKSAL